MTNDLQQTNWEPVKEFTDIETQITIKISARTLVPLYAGQIPLVYYSYEIGRKQGDRLHRHFQVQCLVEYGRAHVVPFPTDVLIKLLHDAEEWVQQQRQEREHRVTEVRMQKEQDK